MFFPPSARFFVPSLVLIFGLAVTWLDYRLNLASDLERNLADVQKQADATGLRDIHAEQGDEGITAAFEHRHTGQCGLADGVGNFAA